MKNRFFLIVAAMLLLSATGCMAKSTGGASAGASNALIGQWYFEKTVSVSNGGDPSKWDKSFQREFGWKDSVALVFTDSSSGAMRVRTAITAPQEQGFRVEEGMMPFTYTADSDNITITFIVNGEPGDEFSCIYAVKGGELRIDGFPDKRVGILLKR